MTAMPPRWYTVRDSSGATFRLDANVYPPLTEQERQQLDPIRPETFWQDYARRDKRPRRRTDMEGD